VVSSVERGHSGTQKSTSRGRAFVQSIPFGVQMLKSVVVEFRFQQTVGFHRPLHEYPLIHTFVGHPQWSHTRSARVGFTVLRKDTGFFFF
jgi:hypothetical protein